jgi:hypothetical protein
MAFNINAQVILSAPKNIQKVRQTISKGLSGISANIDLKVDTKSAGALKSINVELEAMKKNLKVINAQKISLGNFRQFSSQATKTATSLSSIGSAAQKTNQSLSKTSKQVKEVTNDITNFGKESALATRRFAAFTIVSGGIFGLVRGFKSGVSQAINFEKQILRVQQVTGDAGVGISSLKREIDILSVSLGVASDELVQVSLTLAQTGKTIPQIRSALTAIAKATLAPTFGDIKDTTEGVIAALEQFNISASKTEEVLGSLNAVSKSFAVEAADLISVIRRAGGVFAAAEPQFKGPQESLNELIAIFTAVRSTTRESAETIATGLRTIFSRIQRPATVQFLKQFGVELVDAQGQFVGTFEAFKRIAAGIEGLQIRGDAIGLARIVEELGGIRQAGKIIPLLQNFAKAEDARRVALEGTASISEDVEIAQKSLGFSIDQLKQKFTKFVRDVVESDSFQNLARTILGIGDNLLSVVDALRPLLPLFTTIASIKISESLINFGKGFIGGFGKLGGAEGLGERIGGLGSVDTVGDSAQTQKVNNVALENNTKSLLDNSAWLSKNTDSLLTLNKTMESVVSVSNNLITAAKSLESKMIALSASQMSQTPGGIFLPPSVGGGSPLKPPRRRSMGGPADGQTLLKSGEVVISPENVKAMKLSNLRKMNQGISMVGGNSPIDSIPADLDDGSFVLNRRGAQGLMSGGMAKRTKADDLFDELDRSLADVLQIPNEWLPEDLRDRRVKKVAVSKILKKLDARDAAAAKRSGRGVSVKFDKDRNITESSPERLAAIESYRSQVEKRGDVSEDDDFSLDYITPNDDKLYRSQMAFVKQLIRERILTEEDFEPEEFSMGGLAAKPASGYTPYKMGDIRRRRRRSTSEDGALTDQAKYYAMLRQKRFGRRFAGTDFEMEEFLEELKEKQQGLNEGGQVKFAGLFLLNKMGQGEQGLAAKISKSQDFFNFDGQTSEIDSTEIDLKDYLGKTNKKLTPQEISQFVKDLTSNENPYFKVRDIDNDIKQLQGKISNLKEKTDPTAISSIARNENIIEFLKNKKDLALEAMQDQKGYFPNIIENRGNLKFELGIGYPPPQAGEEVFKTAIEGFLHSSKQAAQDLSSGLGVSIGPPVSDADLLKNVGIFDVAGKVFESAVNQLGPPLTSGDGGAQRGFDFPEGLTQLSSNFNLQGFEKAPTDAKISLTSDSKSSIKNKKIPNLIKERLDAITKPWKTPQGVFDLPKNFKEKSESKGYTDALFQSIGVSFDPPRTIEEIEKESRGQSLVGVNRGGDITSGSEIANTILTPGELVFPPDEVQRAGLSNLMSFNKTGDPSFLNDFNPNNISMVPGSGNTDTHEQILPAGSFVVKKKSSESMGDGFQKLRSGGLVGDPQPLKAGGMAQPSMAKSLLPALPGIALAATQLGGIDFSNMQQVTTVLFPMLSVMIGSVTDKLGDYKKSKEEYIKNQEQLANSIPHLTDEIIESAKKLRSATGKPAVTAEQERATRKYIDERLQKLPEADRAKKLSSLKDKLTGQRSDAIKQMGPLGRLQLGAKEGFAKGIFGQGLKEIPAGLIKLSKGLGIAAAASLAAGPAIDQLTSFIFKDNKRETLASGETGLTGKDASKRAVAGASLKGLVSGGAIGFTVGNAIFPGAGGAIGAAAGAFLGAVNAAVNAKSAQLKFENLLRISDASKSAAIALEKLKDVTNAKEVESYNKAIAELFKAQIEATDAIAEEQLRIINRSWEDFFYEGTMAFVGGVQTLFNSVYASLNEFFRGITGLGGIFASALTDALKKDEKEQEVRTTAFSQGLKNIDPSVLKGVIDTSLKISENAFDKLSLDELKKLSELDLNSSNVQDYINVLEASGNVIKAETDSLKQIVAARANLSGQTIQQAIGDSEKASQALLAPIEIFSRELAQNKSIEQASKTALSGFKRSLGKDFDTIFQSARSLEDIGEIFDKLNEEQKRQLAQQLNLGSVANLRTAIGALSDASGRAETEILAQQTATLLLKRQLEAVKTTIDAIGTSFSQLAARLNNVSSDLNIAAGNLQIDLDNIFSTTGGSLVRKQNVNVFENIAGRSITEFENAVDRLSKAAGLSADKMSDIPATLVVTEKIPEILKKTVDAVRESNRGVTEISGTELQKVFIDQIKQTSGIDIGDLSEPVRDSILESFDMALGEAGGRSSEGGGGPAKLFSLKALEAAVGSGKIQSISSELLEKIRQEAASLEQSISAFQDTMYQAADFQRRILEEQMNTSMEILNRQQSINSRMRRILDLNFDPLQNAIDNQAARISQLTGGQINTTDPIAAVTQLVSRQQTLRSEKDRIEKRQSELGPAESLEAFSLSQELGSVQQALQDNSKAIEELKNSNEILESATEMLTKANEARMSARERATFLAEKISDAKSPMELQDAITEFLKPTIAASKALSNISIDPSEFTAIMRDPAQVQAAFGFDPMQMEFFLAKLSSQFVPFIANLFQMIGVGAPMPLAFNMFGAGGTMAGGLPDEQAALNVINASTMAANQLTEALSNQNSVEAMKNLNDFNTVVLAAGEAAVAAGKQFEEFRRTMLGGNGAPPTPPQGNNQGGLIGYNKGGLVPNSILTPGEKVFSPSATKIMGVDNLQKLNRGGVATVPGVGSTDSVPAFLEPGSFVLNKGTSRGLERLNDGGTVDNPNQPAQSPRFNTDELWISDPADSASQARKRGSTGMDGMGIGGDIDAMGMGGNSQIRIPKWQLLMSQYTGGAFASYGTINGQTIPAGLKAQMTFSGMRGAFVSNGSGGVMDVSSMGHLFYSDGRHMVMDLNSGIIPPAMGGMGMGGMGGMGMGGMGMGGMGMGGMGMGGMGMGGMGMGGMGGMGMGGMGMGGMGMGGMGMGGMGMGGMGMGGMGGMGMGGMGMGGMGMGGMGGMGMGGMGMGGMGGMGMGGMGMGGMGMGGMGMGGMGMGGMGGARPSRRDRRTRRERIADAALKRQEREDQRKQTEIQKAIKLEGVLRAHLSKLGHDLTLESSNDRFLGLSQMMQDSELGYDDLVAQGMSYYAGRNYESGVNTAPIDKAWEKFGIYGNGQFISGPESTALEDLKYGMKWVREVYQQVRAEQEKNNMSEPSIDEFIDSHFNRLLKNPESISYAFNDVDKEIARLQAKNMFTYALSIKELRDYKDEFDPIIWKIREMSARAAESGIKARDTDITSSVLNAILLGEEQSDKTLTNQTAKEEYDLLLRAVRVNRANQERGQLAESLIGDNPRPRTPRTNQPETSEIFNNAMRMRHERDVEEIKKLGPHQDIDIPNRSERVQQFLKKYMEQQQARPTPPKPTPTTGVPMTFKDFLAQQVNDETRVELQLSQPPPDVYNRGGPVTNPNSILTPGEAVFTPAMTKSLGHQNLSYFNKTGDSSALSGFNRGGISKVPGVGNTDSVPAHLPTGSFVVKKSSAANLPGFNRGTASLGTSSMQRMIGDFISFTKSFFNKLSGMLPTMKASEAANSTTLASEQKAGNVQQINNDIILLPQKLDESFRVFDNVTNRFITQFNPLINQLDNAVTRLEALPALQVQLDAKVGPVEVILNGVELLGAFEDRIKGTILSAVSDQIAKLVPNADGSQRGLT